MKATGTKIVGSIGSWEWTWKK